MILLPLLLKTVFTERLPLSNVVVLFAVRYKTTEAEAASMLLVSTLLFVVTVPVTLWLGK
jgi:predicted permease